VDGDRQSLTDREVVALAGAFYKPAGARQLLTEAGLPPGRQPTWHDMTAVEFWREVNALLTAGVVRDGRRRVLAAALHAYPANPVFAGHGGHPPSHAHERPSAAPAGEEPSPAAMRSFVLEKIPAVQRWGDTESLVEVVRQLLAPGERPLDLAAGSFGRSVPGSGIILVTDRRLVLADRNGSSRLSRVLPVELDTITDVRLGHRRRGFTVAVSDLELTTVGGRLQFCGMLREPALRIAEAIRRRVA
jgi:hypothetical protein